MRKKSIEHRLVERHDGSLNAAPASPAEGLSYKQQWVAFWTLGTLNNFGYVLIQSCAKSLAESFDATNLIGVIQWANVGVGVFLKGLNTWLGESIRYSVRMTITSLLLLAGFLCLSFSVYINFYFAIFSIVLIGSASSVGESIILGFLKSFNPNLTGAWSSGTGMAGVSGTLLYLLLRGVAHLSNQSIFLIATPTVVIYYIAFRIINRSSAVATNSSAPLIPSATTAAAALSDDMDDEENPSNGPVVSATPPVAEKGRTCRVLRMVWWRSTQLALVYFFEYVASVGFAAKANPKHPDDDWWRTNAFEILAFCYQIGVLISRSSISIIKIKRIEIMTILQGANFVLWLFQALDPFIPLWLQFTHMVFVGLLGGGMYVNVFYLLVSDQDMANNDRELGINLASIFINIGIVSAAVFELIADNTFLSHLVH